jgi:16S rRNA pseudouridine516 synthase
MGKIHLHQFLSRTGQFSSKNEIKNRAEKGEFRIDDTVIKNCMYRFNPDKKKVFWNNRILKTMQEKVYIIINKPAGYLSTRLAEDWKKQGKRSVFDLIDVGDKLNKTLFSAGRLDEDTSGLLIITNDGKLNSKIINPKREIMKKYDVVLQKPISPEMIKKLEQGIIIKLEVNGRIERYKTMPCKIRWITDKYVQVVISEGKKRQIKRMFEALGNKVVKLERISVAGIKLSELKLKEGEYLKVEKDYIEKRI